MVGLLPITRAQCHSLPSFVTNKRLFRKLNYQTPPGGASAFILLSSNYKVLNMRIIALNNVIQYSHCHVVQLFRLTSFSLNTFITIMTEHCLLVRWIFRQDLCL